MPNLVDRCIFNATSTGTVDFVVASAVTGYLTPAQAGASNGLVYYYAAQTVDGSGNITEWEVGSGAYTTSGTTLARTTIEFSSNSNNKVDFLAVPQVMLTALSASFVDTGTITYVIDGGGSTITTGTKGYLEIPFDCNIMVSTMLGDTTGNAIVDIWKCTYSAFDAGATHPATADTITTAGSIPTITTGNSKAQDTTLSGWSTATTAGSILAFHVNTIASIKRLTLSLKIQKR